MRVIVIELLIHLCWFPIIFAHYQESERQVMEEMQTEFTWEGRAVEVLEQILSSKLETPPPSPTKPIYIEDRRKIFQIEIYVKKAKHLARHILNHIKKRNATASKSLWETSSKSAREARQLAEEAASFTKDVFEKISEKRKMKAVAAISSHVEAEMRSNNRSTSQFHNSEETANAFLMKASKDSPAQLSNLTSELRSFQLMAKGKVDAVRKAAEADVNQTIEYLHLAQSLWFEPFSKKWTSLYIPHLRRRMSLDEVASFAKEEAIRRAREASQESLNDVQKKFDSFKGVNSEKAKDFEYAIEHAIKETRNIHKEIIENWTRTNRDAIAISRTFFNFTEVQSVLGRAKSAIDRTIVDIEKAKHSSRWEAIEWNLVKMSDFFEKVINAGRDLGTFKTFEFNLAKFNKLKFNMAKSMDGMWAHDYGLRAKERVLRLKGYLSNWIKLAKINQTKSIDLREAVIKWDEAKRDNQSIAEISLAAVGDATHEMRKNVDLVQDVFHVTEVKAEGIKEEYRQQCFVASREAKDVVTETKLAIAREIDYTKRTAGYNFHKTKDLVLKAQGTEGTLRFFCIVFLVIGAVGIPWILVERRLLIFCIGFLVIGAVGILYTLVDTDRRMTYFWRIVFLVILAAGIPYALVAIFHQPRGEQVFSCCWKKFLPDHHTDIETEDDHLKLSERQMREVLQLYGVEINEDKNEEKLLELLRQHQHKLADDDEASKCKVCMDADIDCVILDCGHLVTCNQCGKKLTECPICRQQVLEVLSVAPVTEREMMRLTNQQVKRLLAICGIGFKDRVAARRKMEEDAIQEREHKCKVCMERVIDCVFLNCGHLMTCTCCGEKLVSSSHYTVNCPICQKQISRVAKIYTT